MLSPAVIGVAAGACCGLLGFWLVARFRAFGPQTLRGAVITSLVAAALLQAIGPAMRMTVAATDDAVALLAVAAPILTFSFWSGGILVRAFAGGDSGSVPGQP